MTPFALKMAWREMRGSYRHFTLSLLAIAIGVGSIVSVRSVSEQIESVATHETRPLVAADISVRLNRPLSPQGESVLKELEKRNIQSVRITELLGMVAPATADGQLPLVAVGKSTSATGTPTTDVVATSQLVEVKAVSAGYPFYGDLEIDPPSNISLLNAEEAFVDQSFLFRLKLRVGDSFLLGDTPFQIKGVILKEPDRVVGPFSLGPRVLLSQEGLGRTDLIQEGSRVTYLILLKLPETIRPDLLKAELEKRWVAESLTVRTHQEAIPRLMRFLENLTTYLHLVGLITLMMGGIGVGMGVQAYLTRRVKTIAILKSLGTTSTDLFLTYFILFFILSGVGGGVGIAIGIAIQQGLKLMLADFLPQEISFHITSASVLFGVGMALLTTFLFAAGSLLKIRRIPSNPMFQGAVETRPGYGRLIELFFVIGTTIVLLAFSIASAGSWKLGGLIFAAVGIALLLLAALTWGLLLILKKIRDRLPLIFRYGAGNLYRPGRPVYLLVLSLGVSVTILLTLLLVYENLLAQMKGNLPKDAPSLFFINIQPNQKAGFETLMSKSGYKPDLTPLVRSRLFSINGKKVSDMNLGDRHDRWYFEREYVLTYQQNLPKYNSIRQGNWWAPTGAASSPLPLVAQKTDGSSTPEPTSALPDRPTTGTPAAGGLSPLPSVGPMQSAWLSVETEAAQHLGLSVGSTVVFDIQGQKVSGKVLNIRDVEWGSFSTNFYFIFAPGALKKTPINYVATVQVPPEKEIVLQSDAVSTFPNLTVISLREILETAARIIKKLIGAIQFMALFGLCSGLIIVSSAVALTSKQRVYEMILFKVLGAPRPVLILIVCIEFVAIGILAVLVGSTFSIGIAWGVVHHLLEISWQFKPMLLLKGATTLIGLIVIVGLLTLYRSFGEKPMAILRAE